MTEENVVMKKLRVEYLTTKQDKYHQEMSYFKIIDKNIDQRVSTSIKEGCKIPWFKNEKGVAILKVKQKYVKLTEPTKDETAIVDITLSHYDMDGAQGYYVKALAVS
jgi:hypothetical protein